MPMLSGQKNDISCKIGNNFLVLVEHQSSVNKNMPLRCLAYINRLFEDLIDDKNKIYRETLINKLSTFCKNCDNDGVFLIIDTSMQTQFTNYLADMAVHFYNLKIESITENADEFVP